MDRSDLFALRYADADSGLPAVVPPDGLQGQAHPAKWEPVSTGYPYPLRSCGTSSEYLPCFGTANSSKSRASSFNC